MNILQIVSSSRTSGAEKHVAVLCDRLKKRGHNVMAVCPHGDWLPEQLRKAEIPTIEMSMRGISAFATPVNLARVMKEQSIDIIHAHLTRATYYALVAGRLAHLPMVSSVHCRSHDVAYRFLFPQDSSKIVSVSDFIRNGLLRKGVAEDKIRTIYNGTEFLLDEPATVPPGSASPGSAISVREEFDLPGNSVLVGLIGRIDEFKGHLVLARAVKAIVDACPRAYFVLVGPDVPEIKREMQEITAAAGVGDHLRFTGVRDDVRRLMGEMDLLTLPSRYEACSMSIIEGMAMGKPVIATLAGGNPELVVDGVTGLLIERTPEKLASSVIELLTNEERLSAMGVAARQRAVERFSATIMVDNIESLYREILGQKTAA